MKAKFKNKRVIFLLPTRGFGGAELHTLTLAGDLAVKGAEITFAFPVAEATKELFQRCLARKFDVRNLPIAPIQASTLKETIDEQRSSLNTLDLRQFDLAVVAAPAPNTAIGLMSALKAQGIPSCVVFHLVSGETKFNDVERKMFIEAMAPSTAMACVSAFTRDMLAQAFRVPAELFLVIENGIRLPAKFKAVAKADLARAIGREDDHIIVTSGRIHPQKGLLSLIEAIPLVLAVVPNCHFVLIGDGPHQKDLEKKILELGISHWVSFFGFIDQPYRYFPEADIVCLPTLFEGLSLTLLEALHAGGCILTTDASYQDRILEDGIDAAIVPRNSPIPLSESIIHLLGSVELRERMRLGAKKTAKHYSEARMLMEYCDLFVNLLRKSVEETNSTGTGTEQTIGIITLLPAHNRVSIAAQSSSIAAASPRQLLLDELLLAPCAVDIGSQPLVQLQIAGEFHSTAIGQFEAFGLPLQDLLVLLVQLGKEYEIDREKAFPCIWEWLTFALLDGRLDTTDSRHSFLATSLFEHYIRFGAAANGLFGCLLDSYMRLSAIATEFVLERCTTPEFISASGNSFKTVSHHFANLPEDRVFERERFKKRINMSTGRAYWAMEPDFSLSGGTSAPVDAGSPKVVVFASHYCYPPHNGSTGRITQVLKSYRNAGYEVLLYTLSASAQQDRRTIEGLKKHLGVKTQLFFPTAEARSSISKAFESIASGKIDFRAFYNEELHSDFQRTCDVYQPNTVHINYTYFGWLVAAAGNCAKTILDTHDIDSHRSEIFGRVKSLCSKLPMHTNDVSKNVYNIKLFRSLSFDIAADERNLYALFDTVLTISEDECEAVQAHCPELNVACLPYIPEPSLLAATHHVPTRGLFVGSRNSINILGTAAIVRWIAPRLSAISPGFNMSIAGSVCAGTAGANGVNLLGFVEDIESLYANHGFTLNGMPCGTGQNIKITESMAHGRPAVCFASVANGAGVRHGINGLIANDFDELYEYSRELSADPYKLARLTKTTSEWAQSNLGHHRFDEIFTNILQK
ncbi:MAG: glycosyltransferase family 4 protein [Telluria sp.]